ncbi:unnamed protein product [Anisakis simplex]|uniref:Aa_trans domain-containing protein n=1 Tax=Anisakis simplex TaxID=6269 RepID=A0A0M3J7U3_ANISI|nr:unnamed protein product [Anisakis simplex]
MLAAVFIAETVPDFGPLMSIVGGSTMSLTSLIFPCFFYLYLVVIDKRTPEKNTGDNYEIPMIGTIGGFCATYSGVRDLLTTNFSPPCYVLPFKTNVTTLIDSRTHTNCCGVGQNISVNGNAAEVCSPFLDYYSQF